MRKQKKLYKNFNKYFIVPFSVFIVFVLLVFGCGKKAPPVPPREAKRPTISDVYPSIDRAIKLTWAIPKENNRIISDLSDCIFCRSKMLNSGSHCKNSSELFKLVSDILIEGSAFGYIKKVLLGTLNPLKRDMGISIV